MTKLTRMDLRGFKSIKRLPNFSLGELTVLIGVNGAGKSNFISFFRLLNRLACPPGNLQYFVAKMGGANALLYDGAGITEYIDATLEFEADAWTGEYSFRLAHAASDTLIFADERAHVADKDRETTEWQAHSSGHRESFLPDITGGPKNQAKLIRAILYDCMVYQFHNTSETARIRQRGDVDDSITLKTDGGNLASFLLRLRDHAAPRVYDRIVETVRQVVPFFADFVLKPWDRTVLLQWREKNTDVVFSSHQASDGTLRLIALIALLLQPAEDLPTILILDEPELGLHPYAVNVIAGLLKSVSKKRQVIVATQSTTLIDYFDPEDIVVVDRIDRESEFKRLDAKRLEEWLEEYSLGELWEKNVLGGRPG